MFLAVAVAVARCNGSFSSMKVLKVAMQAAGDLENKVLGWQGSGPITAPVYLQYGDYQ